MIIDFLKQCADNGIVIVPVKLYGKYGDDGNVHAEDFIGYRFVVLNNDNEAVISVKEPNKAWIMVDDSETDLHKFYKTPEEALSQGKK